MKYVCLVLTYSKIYCRTKSFQVYILQNMENPFKRFESVASPSSSGQFHSIYTIRSKDRTVCSSAAVC